MAKIVEPLLTSKWVTLLILYVSLMGATYYYQLTNSATQDEHIVTISGENPPVIYIKDPVHSSIDRIKSMDNERLQVELNQTSFSSNSDQLIEFLDSLSSNSFHLIGEGIGGNVAITLAANSLLNDRLLSLTLVNANGIEELSLMGSSYLNKAIYKAKIITYSILINWTPHFGFFDHLQADLKKAEIQYQSNYPQIQTHLKAIELPVFLVQTDHTTQNSIVILEQQRQLPQSEVYVLTKNDSLSNKLGLFFEQVESGTALTRKQTTIAKQIAAIQPIDPAIRNKTEGKALFILMLLIILSTFITEDLTCVGTGLLIANGTIGFIPGTIACLLGIFVGDILLYGTGRWLAAGTLQKAPLKWFISEKDMEMSYHWFEAKGPVIIIASRFIPGTRLPTYVSAGAIGANFLTFIFYFGIASILWTPILVGLAVILGNEMIKYFTIYHEYAIWILFGALALFYVVLKVLVPSFTHKGRRLNLGRFRRILNWEFWSPFFLYAPVLVYCIFLWIKHKSITLVTLANPGIEFGGLVNESKSKILKSIGQSESVATFDIIAPGTTSFSACEQFMEERELKFPIVLKPDIGERGKDVVIVKNVLELARYAEQFNERFIIQEYIDGLEFGVFYVRFPKHEKGQIFSITKKEYLNVVGDGKQTLEDLILNDDRAVCMAKTHFQQHADHLFSIPAKGEKINLVEIGTHSRGAIFKDAVHLNTHALQNKVDELSKSIEGFYFGRFDIKVPDEIHFKEGAKLKVLEVNGITSEATHIYDPKYPFWYAVKVLCTQWSMAYKIAAQLKAAEPNLNVPTIRQVLALIR